MTNHDKFLSVADGVPSPQNYLEWSWLSLVAAALGRKVSCPPEHDPIYPNMYITLVGDPGVGKGAPIRLVKSFLEEHKLDDINNSKDLKGDEKFIVDKTDEENLKAATEDMTRGMDKQSSVEKPLLIPVAADAVTYEALVQSMSHCLRRINYLKMHPDGNQRMAIYSHSSQVFCLEEVASLFRKNQNSLVNFLIQAYDCGESYEYRTKNGGRDRVLRICVNFLGGTTPDFMQEVFTDSLVNQGYSSRTFYIYGAKNRKSVFFRPELSDQQRQYKKDIGIHVKALAKLYGQVRLDQDTIGFLTKWKQDFDEHPEKRTAKSAAMKAFWARINIHVMKVAMAKWFGETTEMHIPKSIFEWAIEYVMEEAKSMQLALCIGGDNKLANTSAKVLGFLREHGKQNFLTLHTEFWGKVNKSELEEIIQFLSATDQIYTRQIKDETTENVYVYYFAKE